MGTTIDYVKSSKRHVWPSLFRKVDDELTIQIGGTHNCGILFSKGEIGLIDSGSGQATQDLKDWLSKSYPHARVSWILNTCSDHDAAGGNELFPEAELLSQKNESQSSKFASESILVQSASSITGDDDRIIYLKSHRILFLGRLFSNRIHPVLPARAHIQRWLGFLKNVGSDFPYGTGVPAEGNLGGPLDVDLFHNYLRDLSDPNVEFSICRRNYDWTEIPGLTSLEENFDFLREAGVK